MNLVTASKKIYKDCRLLFIAAGRKIFIKKIPIDSEPSRQDAKTLVVPVKEPFSDADEQVINAVEIGDVNGVETLATVDTAGQLCLWSLANLDVPIVVQLDESAWSISFSVDRIFVGCNAHVISEVCTRSWQVVRTWSEHDHNIPSVAISSDGRWLGSVSIDSSFCLRDTVNGKSSRYPLGKWGWTCRCISVKNIESVADYGINGQEYRCANKESYNGDSDTGDSADYIRQIEHSDAVEWMEDFEDSLNSDPSEADWHSQDDELGALVPSDAVWTAEDIEEVAENGSYESDTGILNHRRLERSSLLTGESVSGDSISQVVRNQRHRSFQTIPTEEAIQSDHLFTVTTGNDLCIYDPVNGCLLSIELSAFHWQTINPRDWLQYNRYCMSLWVPELSCLILGNQAGFVTIVRFMFETLTLCVKGMSVHGNSPLVGFSVYKTSELEFSLYMLHLTGAVTMARIERIIQSVDISNTVLC
ncbi:hypothetical protein PSACC_02589 [Paramicrosporidium saccamoebae]|uniref:Uncharacterized protein n=1 Tax=Paramicrosporidium saccamoebae TaxID=1246581 RepID=A0A2H9TIF9_9FUNG|nr:hypothetical protein PSACC_02589 [Paramicrosporidium saccamoebae]